MDSGNLPVYLLQSFYEREMMRLVMSGIHHFDDLVGNGIDKKNKEKALETLITNEYVYSGAWYQSKRQRYYLPTTTGTNWYVSILKTLSNKD